MLNTLQVWEYSNEQNQHKSLHVGTCIVVGRNKLGCALLKSAKKNKKVEKEDGK